MKPQIAVSQGPKLSCAWPCNYEPSINTEIPKVSPRPAVVSAVRLNETVKLDKQFQIGLRIGVNVAPDRRNQVSPVVTTQ